jgi:hypothetical protein
MQKSGNPVKLTSVQILLESIGREDFRDLDLFLVGGPELIVPLPVAVVQDVGVRVGVEALGGSCFFPEKKKKWSLFRSLLNKNKNAIPVSDVCRAPTSPKFSWISRYVQERKIKTCFPNNHSWKKTGLYVHMCVVQ